MSCGILRRSFHLYNGGPISSPARLSLLYRSGAPCRGWEEAAGAAVWSGRIGASRAMTQMIPLKMPGLLGATEGQVDRWLKKEGDAFASGESLCEVTVGGVTVGMNIKEAGILARRTAREGQIINVGEEIGLAVDGKAAYMTYIESLRVEAEEKQFMDALQDLSPSSVASDTAAAAAIENAATAGGDAASASVKVALLREIKKLNQKGDIDEASSRVLMGMARRGDAGLSDLFLASFDSAALDPATFDAAFFAENAAALVKEELEKGAKK